MVVRKASVKGEGVVRIDSSLLKRIEEYINKEENRLRYTNKKQFVDIAVMEKLKREAKNGK